MQKVKHKELAKRLAINAINNYRTRFIYEEDLLNGEDRKAILAEVDRILWEIKEEKVSKLSLENGIQKNKIKELEDRLNHIVSLEDCDEEFEY